MKNLVLLFLCLVCNLAYGQIINGGTFKKYLDAQAQKKNQLLNTKGKKPHVSDPEFGKSYNISMSTFAVPVSFSRIEIENNEYKLGTPLSIGIGYSWIFGKAVYNQDETLQVFPGLFFGLGIDTGVKPDNADLKGTLSGNVFIGFSKVALNAGYDIVNKNVFFGLGTKIDVFSFFNTDRYTVYRLWDNPKPKPVSN